MVNAPIDLEQLDKIATNEDEVDEILRELLDQSRVDLSEMQAALRGGDIVAAGRIAHRIKGAGRMVGADTLANICEAMERACRDGKLAFEQEAIIELTRLIRWLEINLDGNAAPSGGSSGKS